MVKLIESMTGDHPARAALVISNDPDAGGLAKANALGIATKVINHHNFERRSDFDQALGDALQDMDIICLAGFMRILDAKFATRFEGRILNIHPSLLPKYKGLNTHARAIEAGDKISGCTVHLVNEHLDAGAILGQAEVEISDGETPQTLAAKILIEEHRLYPAILRDFAT